jgi:hypothetical protein
MPGIPDLTGCTSYIGHPSTRAVVESYGAKTAFGRWSGPAIGETYLAISLSAAANSRLSGMTVERPVLADGDLVVIACTRMA